jgi:hypothetical protein
MMVAPGLMSAPGGVIYQETMGSMLARIDAFLDSQNISSVADYKQRCSEVAAAGVANSTAAGASGVLSGWVQSQSRFGMCYIPENTYGGVFSLASLTSIPYADGLCDQDPSVIGFLQTISMQWVCEVHYAAPACNWTASYGGESIVWEPRPGYVPGSVNGGSDAQTGKAPIVASPTLGWLIVTIICALFFPSAHSTIWTWSYK